MDGELLASPLCIIRLFMLISIAIPKMEIDNKKVNQHGQ